ncbi:MAG: MOSC domain-containing protein [Polyangiaceae bacterium]|nr:MOSC domain-containing protein [Polyangiaceae bacterium]
MDRPWTTGFYKDPVSGPVALSRANLAGDGQADLRYHGGPDKAVLACAAEHYPAWRAELDLPGLTLGGFGENLAVEGWSEAVVCLGDVVRVGTAILQVSQPRSPCWKISRRWRVKDLSARVQQSGRGGWYHRVIQEGIVEAGQALALLERPHPEWTVSRANHVMCERQGDSAEDRAATLALAGCDALTAGWREALRRRAEEGIRLDERARLVGPNDPGDGNDGE